MSTRRHLAHIARSEALRFFHGAVMRTAPTIQPIIAPFPNWPLEAADGMWCAAFVYYCCIQSGFKIPIRPAQCRSCNLAGCGAWEEWALADPAITYRRAHEDGFSPEPGDIVLFDRVFSGQPHDHIGIIVEHRTASIVTAEGNINNVSGVIERAQDAHIRAYIRLPDGYIYREP